MLKLVFISDIATPQQIKFCQSLQEYFNSYFFFYESPNRTRGDWWSIELGEKCAVLTDTWFAKPGLFEYRYYSPSLIQRLENINPDIVMIGGFSRPSNYLCYRWAKMNGKKTIVITERSRKVNGTIRKSGFFWLMQKYIYRNIDHIMVTADDIKDQFSKEFGFGNKKVSVCPYAADLEAYFTHSTRIKKIDNSYIYLFANRLTNIYNPILAINIFYLIRLRYPKSSLLMNGSGELRKECEKLIRKLHLEKEIIFLDNISKWDELHQVYKKSDILLFPANFSNGNFTILEAMASGMGIIISNKILGIGKLIQDNKNGYVCFNDDINSYLDAVNNYILNPENFLKHKNINRLIANKFTPSEVAKTFNKNLIRL